MQTTLKIKYFEHEIPVVFYYEIEPGQKQTKEFPGIPDQVIDIDWIESDRGISQAIWDDLESIETQLLADARKQKEEALADVKINNLE